MTKRTKRKKDGKSDKNHFFEWAEALVFAFVVVTTVRVFVFDIFIVPSSSMENAIMAGDIVMVNKLRYGARLPFTPLTVPFMHQNWPYNSQVRAYSSIVQLPYFRFPGYNDIKRNDILVFNYPIEYFHPIDHRTYYVKRCAGMPGDTISIINTKLFVNGKQVDELQTIKKPFQVHLSDTNTISRLKSEYPTDFAAIHPSKGLYRMLLDAQKAEAFDSLYDVKKIKPEVIPMGETDFNMHGMGAEDSWNQDFYGPIYVPKAGDKIALNDTTLSTWLDVIIRHENQQFEMIDGIYFLNGKQADSLTFSQNYYFVLGDNRSNSADSRFWGFVPENHIIGTPAIVLLSVNKNASKWWKQVRWNRIFKWIN